LPVTVFSSHGEAALLPISPGGLGLPILLAAAAIVLAAHHRRLGSHARP
jgi:hypothetical protein